MLDFIIQNNALFSTIAILGAGFFAFIKWIDNRNRELKEKRYSKYMALISIISGKREDGTTPNLTEQIAATWFLLEYPEYKKTTKKIFENSDLKNMANGAWVEHVLPQIEFMLKEI